MPNPYDLMKRFYWGQYPEEFEAPTPAATGQPQASMADTGYEPSVWPDVAPTAAKMLSMTKTVEPSGRTVFTVPGGETAEWTPGTPGGEPSPTAKRMGLYPGAPPGTYNSLTGRFTSRAEEERQGQQKALGIVQQEMAAEEQATKRRQTIQGIVDRANAMIASGDIQQILGGVALMKQVEELGGKETVIPEGGMLVRGGDIRAYNPKMAKPGEGWQTRTRPDGTVVLVNTMTGETRSPSGPGAQPIKTAQPFTDPAIAGMLSGVIPLPPGVTREMVETARDERIRMQGAGTGARTRERIRAETDAADDLRKIAAARAGGMVEGRIAPDVPMSPEALEKFGLPFGSTWKDAMGMIASNPKARLAVEELKVSTNLLNALGGYADKLITAPDWQSAATQGATLWTGAFTRANADAAVFADQREALLGVFSRQIGAERGVLTDRDIHRIDKALPNFRDTKEVKDKKMALLKSMIQVNREARTKSISVWLDSDIDLTTATKPIISPETSTPQVGERAKSRLSRQGTIPRLNPVGMAAVRALPPGTKKTVNGVEYTREELLGE